MMWTSICLLESDFEYEFLFAVRLLDQLIPTHIDFARSDHVEKLRSVLHEVCIGSVCYLLTKGGKKRTNRKNEGMREGKTIAE